MPGSNERVNAVRRALVGCRGTIQASMRREEMQGHQIMEDTPVPHISAQTTSDGKNYLVVCAFFSLAIGLCNV